jgi:hypothetical protein
LYPRTRQQAPRRGILHVRRARHEDLGATNLCVPRRADGC